MDSLIQLSSQMQWPFTFALIGIGAAISIPVITTIASNGARRRAEIEAEKSVDIRRIEVSVKNGAVPARIED